MTQVLACSGRLCEAARRGPCCVLCVELAGVEFVASAEMLRSKKCNRPDSNPGPPAPNSSLLTTRTRLQMLYEVFMRVQRAPRVSSLPFAEVSLPAGSCAATASAATLVVVVCFA